jgi:hypothetical protein
MKRKQMFGRRVLVAVGFAASFSVAAADEAPAPTVNPPPAARPRAAELSLQGFATQNPLCREWSDGCSICARDDNNARHCSTPGIACQPEPIRCRRETTK